MLTIESLSVQQGKKIKYNTWKFKKDTDCLGRQGSLFTEKKLMVTG